MSERAAANVVALVPIGHRDVADPLSSVRAAAVVASASGVAVDAVVLAGDATDAHGSEALAAGAAETWLVSHRGLPESMSSEVAATAFAAALASPEVPVLGPRSLVLSPAGGGEELAARLAARLSGVPFGRCLRARVDATGVHLVRANYGGRAEVTLESDRGPWFATLRAPQLPAAGSIVQPPAAASAAGSALHRLTIDSPLPATRIETRVDPHAAPRKAALEGARVVVSGGRGIGGPEGFELLQAIADLLGGALGGSLPTVDAGWVPVSRQVGQSGKFVTPQVYLAVAISGTPQHLAGVGEETRIVAINSDPGADIFRVAEVGVVGEWQALLPTLVEALQKR